MLHQRPGAGKVFGMRTGSGRPLRLRAAGALGLALAALACSEPPSKGAHGIRHVVLISLDTTRADHLGCYGGRARTPVLDALAGAGVRFADVTSPAPTTLAAHTSMMTGTYPRAHGVPRNGFIVHRDNVMLAEILADAGFHTAGFVGSFALERAFGFHQGFAHFDQEFDIPVSKGGYDQNQRRAAAVTDAVLAHLDDARPRGRLFLFAHYFDAHAPYDPPPPFDRWYSDREPLEWDLAEHMGSVAAHQLATCGRSIPMNTVVNEGVPPEMITQASGEALPIDGKLAALYAGEISYMDAEIGRLLEGLAARGILDEALVVVTGDHGETFWEHGDFWNHGLWVYQTTVSVPLILRFPDGSLAGSVEHHPVSTVDLVPTLCDLLELDPPQRGFDGRSQAGGMVLEGTTGFQQIFAVFSQATQPAAAERQGRWANAEKAACVRSGKWKYVSAPYLGLEQLFDLEADPGERVNLLADSTPRVEQLRGEMREQLEYGLDASRDPTRALPSRFNRAWAEEMAGVLEALGYSGEGEAQDGGR